MVGLTSMTNGFNFYQEVYKATCLVEIFWLKYDTQKEWPDSHQTKTLI